MWQWITCAIHAQFLIWNRLKLRKEYTALIGFRVAMHFEVWSSFKYTLMNEPISDHLPFIFFFILGKSADWQIQENVIISTCLELRKHSLVSLKSLVLVTPGFSFLAFADRQVRIESYGLTACLPFSLI